MEQTRGFLSCLARRLGRAVAAASLALLAWTSIGHAGPLEDGVAAYQAENYEAAYSHWRPLAEQGSPAAQFGIALLYGLGRGGAEDDRKALTWLRRAAASDYPEALLKLGIAYYQGGSVVAKNDPTALGYFYRLQEHDEEAAAPWIGKVYAGLFPAPLPDWQAGEVASRRAVVGDLLVGRFYEITLERLYQSPGTGESAKLQITNAGLLASLVPLLHADPETLDAGQQAIVKNLKDQGITRYTYRRYQGMAGDDGVMVRLDDSTVVAFELTTRTTSQAYLDHTDLERIRDTIDKISIDILFDEYN